MLGKNVACNQFASISFRLDGSNKRRVLDLYTIVEKQKNRERMEKSFRDDAIRQDVE